MQSNRRLVLAIVAAAAWGLLPLLLFLPAEALPHWAEQSILMLCAPGCLAAYIVVGGVHSQGMDILPAVAALFTGLIVFGAIRFVFWIWAKFRSK